MKCSRSYVTLAHLLELNRWHFPWLVRRQEKFCGEIAQWRDSSVAQAFTDSSSVITITDI